MSTATASERGWSPGTDVMLEVSRLAVNEQLPTLMPALYTCSTTTERRPYASLYAMWRVLVTKRMIRHPQSTATHLFSVPVSSTGARSSAPSGPPPADHGRGHGRVPCKLLSWQTGSIHHPNVMPIDDLSDTRLDHTSNCGPLEEHHYAEVFAVSASFKTDDPPRWSGFLSPRANAFRENGSLCLNCHDNNHSFKHSRHPFLPASVNLVNLATVTHTNVGKRA